jgi:agmatine deiminase
MPGEWEPHAATLLAWPHQSADWPGKFSTIPWVYAEIVRQVARSEPVLLLVPPQTTAKVRGLLNKNNVDLTAVTFIETPTDRVWVRDSGPIVVYDDRSQRVFLDWKFNAWAKYDNWHQDDQVPSVVAEHLQAKRMEPIINERRIVLEGGGIDVNGAGLVLTTEEWLLSDTQVRNPGLSRSDYESVFADWLGATETIWLGQGIVGDDTHGHVDDLARFVDSDTVVMACEDDPADANYRLLQENHERLLGWRGRDGRKLTVVKLPMPGPIVFRKQRLPASYANFYIGNEVLLVPTFNDPNDRGALGILADLVPNRRVIGIHAVDLVWGLGTLHCLSQQIPPNIAANVEK